MQCSVTLHSLTFFKSGIFKNTISKYNDKEEAILLEIQSDILLILSGLCEHHIPGKVCMPVNQSFVQIFQSHNIRNYFLVNVHKCWCFLILR